MVPKVGIQDGRKEVMKSISGMMKTHFMLLRLWALCICMCYSVDIKAMGFMSVCRYH